MVQVTIVQEIPRNGYSFEEKLVGTFDNAVAAMPFLSEMSEHFQYKRIEIEEVVTEELPDTEEGNEG